MANFVFCAGGGVGGWCWRDMKLDYKLRGAGHEVFMPTYTGVGERVHLSNPEIDLNTHIQDILMHLKYEDLKDVILIGHSYGGMIIAAVAEQVPERIRHLVSLDGYIPENGQSIADIVGSEVMGMYEENAQSHGDGWLLVPVWEDADPRDTSHPLATAYPKVVIDNAEAAKIPRTYIYCTEGKEDDPIVRFTSKQIQKVKSDPRWDYREIHTDHAVTEIDELVEILLEIGGNGESLARAEATSAD